MSNERLDRIEKILERIAQRDEQVSNQLEALAHAQMKNDARSDARFERIEKHLEFNTKTTHQLVEKLLIILSKLRRQVLKS